MWNYRRASKEEKSIRTLKLREDLLYFIALIGPIMTIPQAYLIWSSKEANGLSIYTWITYFSLSIFWFMHGWRLKDRLLIVNNICNFIINGFVLLGIILYR